MLKRDLPLEVTVEFECREDGNYLNDIGCIINALRRESNWDISVSGYAFKFGAYTNSFNVLTRCDCTTRNEKKAQILSGRMDDLEARIAVLAEKEELAAIRPELDGSQVMAHLGLAPGRMVGKALSFLLEIRLDEGMLGETEIRRRLDEWWNSQS